MVTDAAPPRATNFSFLETREADTIAFTGLDREIKRAAFLETGAPLAVDHTAKAITLPHALPDQTGSK